MLKVTSIRITSEIVQFCSSNLFFKQQILISIQINKIGIKNKVYSKNSSRR